MTGLLGYLWFLALTVFFFQVLRLRGNGNGNGNGNDLDLLLLGSAPGAGMTTGMTR